MARGFGSWAVRDKQGSCFLGCAELRLAGEGIEGIAPDEVEAGWWVAEDRRNDGIATEAMEAAIDDLFSRTDVETITAYISRECAGMYLEAQALNQAVARQPKKATIASPISFAPMIRKSTAMIVALLRAIQPRTVSSGS